jgi:hypothetical protein
MIVESVPETAVVVLTTYADRDRVMASLTRARSGI